MFDFRDQQIGIRVTAQQKQTLIERAKEQGQSLTEFILMIVGSYDDLNRQLAQLTRERTELTEQLDQARQSHEAHKTALDQARDLAGQVTARKLDAARREAVEQYRKSLLNAVAMTGDPDGFDDEPDPQALALLRTRLASYETPALMALFEQLRGNETDVVEEGRPVTVTIEDVPDVVRVMVFSFTPQFDEEEE